MSIHFNQQVLYAYSNGTLDLKFLESCQKKGYDLNQTLFDWDGKFNRDIFYFVCKSYHDSLDELFSILNFLLDNGFKFKGGYNYFYYFLIKLAELKVISHPSHISYICSYILKMQTCGLNFTKGISYYYDPDLFHFILINSYTSKFTKLSISSIVFIIISNLKYPNLFHQDDYKLSENTVIGKKYVNNIKIRIISTLKNLTLIYDSPKKEYVLKRLT